MASRFRHGLYRVTDPSLGSDLESSYGDGAVVDLGSAWVWGEAAAYALASKLEQGWRDSPPSFFDATEESEWYAALQPYQVVRVDIDEACRCLDEDTLDELGMEEPY